MQKMFFLILLCFVTEAFASAKLTAVKIKGNQRIEKAAILNKISFQAGQTFSKARVTADVKRLFETGFFYNIKVDLTEAVLTYTVEEKPMLSEVEYVGNRAIDDDDLSEVSKINANELLDIKKVNLARSEIKKKYEEKGFFLVKVTYATKKQKNGAQKLIFNIKEGDKVKIRKVNLIGNKALGDAKLKSVMATREVGILGMGGSFKQETLARDKEVLAFIYQNEGYAQVKVSRPNLSLTRDKRGIRVSFHIEEGLKYKVDEVSFSGDVDFTQEELLKLTEIDESKYFSRATLLSDISKVQAKYGDEGYAYANVVPRPKMNDKEALVSIDYKIDKGNKVKIGEINVKGNSNTRDKVVRRELRIFEGELYNETEKRRSEANVKRLGFFEAVDFQSKVSNEDADVMDLDIQVKERSTGQLNIGAGYGGFQGFSLQGSVQQSNFLGKGVNFGLNINYSERRQQLFNLNVTDPYFRDTNWSVGVDAFRSLRLVLDYQDIRTGGALSFGRRINDHFLLSLKYKFEKVELDLDSQAFTDVFTEDLVQDSQGYSSGVTLSAVFDKRNDRLFPTKGYYARAAVEQTGLGGDLTFTRLSGNARFYKPLIGSLVWRNNFNYGWVTAPGEVPINELFRLGGPNSVRGYNFFSIAQRRNSQMAYNAAIAEGFFEDADALSNVPFGGIQQFYYNLEFEWGLIKEAGIKGVVFFDVGTANDKIEFDDLNSAWGLGFRWNSPMGPLRFEWAFAIDPDTRLREPENDFQFSIMQSF